MLRQSITSIGRLIKSRREVLLLGLMLEFLHFAIWIDFGSPLSRSLLLIHLGLFLIWQPVWRGDEKLAWYNGLMFILLTLVFVTWINLLLLSGWLILLTGVCGGRVIIDRRERAAYMLVLIFLVSEILIASTTLLFGINIPTGIRESFSLLLPLLPLFIVLVPSTTEERPFITVDIVHASVVMLLVSLLVLGSLVTMYHSNTEYIPALAQTLIAIGLLLLLISWLLSPRAGFSGLSQLWLRSILNIGTPFEQWLNEIDNLFERENNPDEFVEEAVWELASLPWLSGARWQTPTQEGETGELTNYSTRIESDQISITLYSLTSISGALYLHCKLLVQLINNYYVAKVRERTLTQQTHLKAIHETGARITHDIKNLLQSLQAITSIISSDENPDDDSIPRQLLRKQLPSLTQRLQLALDKLQAPAIQAESNVHLKDWWYDLQRRTSLENIDFQSSIEGDPLITADLFDSVTDNLLDNLREKALLEPQIRITVAVHSNGGDIRLRICDTGSRLPDDKARRLFQEPLESDSGLGIGLLQAARQARGLGYTLSLASNEDGRVCFELASADIGQDTTETSGRNAV